LRRQRIASFIGRIHATSTDDDPVATKFVNRRHSIALSQSLGSIQARIMDLQAVHNAVHSWGGMHRVRAFMPTDEEIEDNGVKVPHLRWRCRPKQAFHKAVDVTDVVPPPCHLQASGNKLFTRTKSG
jgi:hypothetical protein